MLDRFRSFLAGKLPGLLKLYPAARREIAIEESLSFETNIAVNRLWYRGDRHRRTGRSAVRPILSGAAFPPTAWKSGRYTPACPRPW